jgi:hypothetical protein
MSSDRAFRIPRAHKDRVHPRQLVAIAATCMSVGVALSGVLAAKQREPSDRGHAWQGAAVGPVLPIDATALLSPITSSETSVSAATAVPALPAVEVATHAGEAAPSHERVSPEGAKHPGQRAKSALVRGEVTYHCAGAHEACPRDPALEARVWRVLARLASCRGTADAFGHAALKLWFAPAAGTQVVFAAPTISPSLNLRAVSQCVATDLSKLRATRNADRFELNLGVELAARN